MRRANRKTARKFEAKKDGWKEYALKHALENWDDADKLIEY